METIEINGKSYLIDIDETIKAGAAKEKDTKPRSWEEYCESRMGGYCACFPTDNYDMFASQEEAEAFHALGKLIQLRDAWWDGWKPDWGDDKQDKYCIVPHRKRVDKELHFVKPYILAFPTEDMRDDFLDTFGDLIEQAKMFL